MPAMIEQFETLRRVLRAIWERGVDGSHELLALTHIYRNLRSANFSQEVLEFVPEQIMVSPMDDVGWSDWSRPSRIIASLDLIGGCPNFPCPASIVRRLSQALSNQTTTGEKERFERFLGDPTSEPICSLPNPRWILPLPNVWFISKVSTGRSQTSRGC